MVKVEIIKVVNYLEQYIKIKIMNKRGEGSYEKGGGEKRRGEWVWGGSMGNRQRKSQDVSWVDR